MNFYYTESHVKTFCVISQFLKMKIVVVNVLSGLQYKRMKTLSSNLKEYSPCALKNKKYFMEDVLKKRKGSYRFIMVLVLLISISGLTGCELQQPTELEGTWVDNEFVYAKGGEDEIKGTDDDEWWKSKLVVEGDEYVFELDIAYGLTQPTLSEIRITVSENFELTGSADIPVGAKKMDSVQNAMTCTLLSEDQVAVFNMYAICGYTDWEVNIPKNIAGVAFSSEEEPQPENGSKGYEIYQIIDGKLYLGDDEFDPAYDGTSEIKRVRKLSETGLTKSE